MPRARVHTAALVLLFVPTPSFEGFGEHPYNPMDLSQLLAGLVVIVRLAALTLTLCHALSGLLFSTQTLNSFGPPPSEHLMPSM